MTRPCETLTPEVRPVGTFTKVRRVVGGVMIALGFLVLTSEEYKAPDWFDDLVLKIGVPLVVGGMIIAFGPKVILRTAREVWDWLMN